MNIKVINKEIFLTNDDNKKFKIYFVGSDLYWTMINYQENNEFIITYKDKTLFTKLDELFSKIKKYDNKYDSLIKDNTFEWLSEANKPEISNKLIILKKEQNFIIKFVQNPNDLFNNTCAICFCLSESRNKEISNTFSLMFINYINKLKETPKTNLDNNINLLFEIYRLFYNENLILKDKNIYTKIKTMISILNEFNNYLGIESLSSLNIENLLNELFLFEEISFIDNQYNLDNDTKEIIKVIGNIIRKHLPNGFEGIDALIKISNIIHEDNENTINSLIYSKKKNNIN